MALYQTIKLETGAKVLIWKIEETFEVLKEDLELSDISIDKLSKMKSQVHRKGFLAVRRLMNELGLKDTDLHYNENGRPLLNNGNFISISHSHNYAAIVYSPIPMGIDVELKQDKILHIASKFTPIEEYRTMANHDALIRKLTRVWCAKEAIYKCFSTPGLSFYKHIDVHDFEMEDVQTKATLVFKNIKQDYQVDFLEFDTFVCSFVKAID